MNPFNKKVKIDQSKAHVILDTCALIDGRILDIARIGFVPSSVVVPQFIVAELQFLADHGDSHKRERARYGLDVVRELQDIRRTKVIIAREKFDDIKEVDDKLIALAKQYGGMLYTTDYNLNKVAQIEGVTVLNVNELAQALRPKLLPGERVEIKIMQLGQDRTQGVGYLDDGTMVVVENGARYLGKRITVQCSRMLQTQAGKMMFAVLLTDHKKESAPPNKAPKQQDKQPAEVAKPAPKPKAVHHAIPKRSARPQRQPQTPASSENKPTARRGPQAVKPQARANNKPAIKRPQQRGKRVTPEDSLIRALQQHS